MKGREAIGKTISRSKLPPLRRVFCTMNGAQVYCAETSDGEFRIIKSGNGWRADEVLEDWVFIKQPARDLSRQVPVKPFRVYPVDILQMPEEVREGLEEAKFIDDISQITAVWHKWSGKRDAYCVETTEALYFVVNVPRWGWAAEVIDHELMLVREGGPDSMDYPNVIEPPRFEIGDELWRKVGPLLPELSRESKRKIRYSNRATLSGVIYRLRSGAGWRRIPAKLGFGGSRAIQQRLLAWDEEGCWRPVQKLLEEELEDGQRLNWDELKLSE